MLAHQVTVAGVSRVNSNGSIAGDSFRTGGCDGEVGPLFLHYRIAEVPQMARIVLMLYLDIRQSGITVNAPVGDTGAFIN